MFSIKRAQIEHMKDVFENSNEDAVRQVSLNPIKINWEDHIKWYEKSINDSQICFYVIYEGEKFIGQVRFNLDGEKSCIVSISLGENGRGKGYSTKILNESTNLLLNENKDIEKIIAYILPENIVSQKLFLKCGYKKVDEEVIRGKRVCKYLKIRGEKVGDNY